MQSEIPLVRPYIAGNEAQYVSEAIRSGQLASDGRFTQACAEFLSRHFGIRKVLLTPSCTAALEMAAMLCDLGLGDEVILPSYTFVSTANAVVLRGATPVFVDIRPDTLNIDDALIEDKITPRTKAIFPVHYAGVACEMERIMTIARKHGLLVVEDAAQAVNAKYQDRFLGAIGDLGTYSFHETKNYVCGEGGALCINNPRLAERAEIIRNKGTNRSQFLRGEVDKYTWVDVGSSYLPSEISAAFLLGQLEQLDVIQASRRRAFEFYQSHLAPLEAEGLLTLPTVPDECRPNYHMFHILTTDTATRDALSAYLKDNGITSVFHYVPLHTSPMGQRYGYRHGDLPVTEDFAGRLLRLPMFCGLSVDDLSRVIDEIRGFFALRRSKGKARPASAPAL
jgi:dTDP-4-amino-4,6-dideoxygalactose transaminase